MTVLILHGIQGRAGKHWMQWLHDQLIANRHSVIMPTLPEPDNPNPKDWRNAISELLLSIDHSNLVMVGHSMGVPAALDYLQITAKPILGLVSVAGFPRDYGAELNTGFMSQLNVDLHKISNLIMHKLVIYGDDDPYVPQSELIALAAELGVEPIVIPNGGHINTTSGFTELPLALDFIQGLST